MSPAVPLHSSDRVLVLAPHPDDETLATGGLIQTALDLRCALRVVHATDGDNNPWPQRWLEKRWHIGARERIRWAQRRRAEAGAALQILGVPVDAVRVMGWRDLHLTRDLLHSAQHEEALAEEIRDFAPTLVVVPVMADRHPDHSALRVMTEIALANTAYADCRRLGYMVHGPALAASNLSITADWQARKERALLAHHSQIVLSRKRLLRLVSLAERFAITAAGSAIGRAPELCRMLIPFPGSQRYLRGHSLLLVLVTAHGIFRARIPLPRWGENTHPFDTQYNAHRIRIRVSTDTLGIHVDLSGTPLILHGYAKLERNWPRLVIYDHDGWHDIRDWINVEPVTAVPARMSAVAG